MSRLLIVLLFSFCSCFCLKIRAQTSDLARLEYTYIPQANSENSVSRIRAFANLPIPLGGWEGSYLIVGFEYRNLDLDFKDPVPFNTEELGQFQLFRSTVAYTTKITDDWRVAGRVGIEVNSNFEAKSIIKDKTGDEEPKPYRFIVGLNYSTNAGRPFPLPVLSYYRKYKPNWSYSLGAPKSNWKYFWNKKNSLQLFATADGFYSNIQNNLDVLGSDGSVNSADNVSMTLIFGGLGYEHYFTKHLLLYLYGGHTFFNEIRLRDTNRNNLYRINDKNTFYLRTGVKFKI